MISAFVKKLRFIWNSFQMCDWYKLSDSNDLQKTIHQIEVAHFIKISHVSTLTRYASGMIFDYQPMPCNY